MEQVHTYGVKHVSGIPTLPITWDSGATVQHKNELKNQLKKGSTHQMDTNKNTTQSGRGWVFVYPNHKKTLSTGLRVLAVTVI